MLWYMIAITLRRQIIETRELPDAPQPYGASALSPEGPTLNPFSIGFYRGFRGLGVWDFGCRVLGGLGV